ncbi:MAG: hypothetical protein KGZ68_16145 [Dechloromonas sp.]|jgi:hypothetical protein|uniref:DUF5947 family protein n=1 Tax=Dechloromonas sp. CZR5 TaxID=2608630 RepID=UPI00123E36B6|nr:DUF5947 family protein [Dechloromonas sp. CZR5]MBS4019757.1 hypothetical protein [Dechloromonas sp.]
MSAAYSSSPQGWVAIDRCYELVGLIRADWQDLSGGPGFEAAIQGFFTRLKASAHSPGLRSHA